MGADPAGRLLALLELLEGAGLLVVSPHRVEDVHDLVSLLVERCDAVPSTAAQTFAPTDHVQVVHDLPYLTPAIRWAALDRLNRARDRLASLRAPVVLVLLDEDVPRAWRVAQDLLDWAAEFVDWPSSGSPPTCAAIYPPLASPVHALPAAWLPWRWPVQVALDEPGAPAWVDVGGIRLDQVAAGLAALMDRPVVRWDLERGDVDRAVAWLQAAPSGTAVLLVGGFVHTHEVPDHLSVVAVLGQAVDPPPGWRRIADWEPLWAALRPEPGLFSPIARLDHLVEPSSRVTTPMLSAAFGHSPMRTTAALTTTFGPTLSPAVATVARRAEQVRSDDD